MSDPWFRFFPSDWLSGTSGLSAAERGVYITLIAMMYDFGGPIKRDDERLARRCGLPIVGFRRALQSLIDEGKINFDGGDLSNERAKREVIERESYSVRQSGRATSGWEKRKQKQSQINAVAMPGQCLGNAGTMPETCHTTTTTTYTPEIVDQRIDSRTAPPSAQPKPSPKQILSEVVSEQTAADVVEHRKKLRKPLTDRSAREIAKALAATGNPEDAAATMLRNGWQGFNPDWYAKAREGPAKTSGGFERRPTLEEWQSAKVRA